MRSQLLHRLAEFIWRWPWLVIVCGVVSAAACIAWSSTSLKLNANTDDLIARDRPYMKPYRALIDEFGELEYIYVVVANTGDVAKTEQAVDDLTKRLRKIDGLTGVFSGVEPDEQLRIASRAMPEAELEGLSLASDGFPALLADQGAGRVLDEGKSMVQQLLRGGAGMGESQQQRLGAAAVFLLSTVAAAQPDSASAKDLAFLLGSPQKTEYFKSDTGKLYFIAVNPQRDYSTLSVIEEPLDKIRTAIAQTRESYPGVDIGLTGKPVLQADEMATTNDDMTLSSIIAFVLCAALFMLMIGGFIRPLLAVLAFVIGSAWTYGAATLLVGQLNLLSIVFMLVLVGVGLDYGVHVISRYREWRLSHNVHDSVVGSLETAVRGNITGAMTSSAVFFMALFTTFQGLRELGLIAGVGLVLCLIVMATVLPALLTVLDRGRQNANQPLRTAQQRAESAERPSVLGWVVKHPIIVLGIAGMASLALLIAPSGLRFEQNLLKLQADGLDSIAWEHRVLSDSASSTWFGAVIADDLEKVRHTLDAAKSRPTIGATHSVLDIIQPPTPRREELRNHLNVAAGPASAGAASTRPEWTVDELAEAREALALLATAAGLRAPDEAKTLREIAGSLKSLEESLKNQATAQATRDAIDANVRRIAAAIRLILDGDRLPLRDALPAGVRQQFMSPGGRFLVMLHPKDDVWEYEPMRQFVGDLRAVDPNATGAPITHLESLGEMRKSFIIMSALALVVIIILLALDFRTLRDVLLAMMPLAVGLLWTVEAMGLLNISFNLANFFSVPILIGLGVDSSVHILHRHHEGGPQRFSLGSTWRAVMLSALTTIIGFGTLILAHHRGLRSLGIVMAIGSTACMVSSVILLPALLAWLDQRKMGKAAAGGRG